MSPALSPATSPVEMRAVTAADLPAIIDLHARVFGPGRFARSAYRVREGTEPVSPYCRLATRQRRLLAALRMTEVTIGGAPGALLLGPLAVEPDVAGQGFGRALVADSLAAAKAAGLGCVVLVGDQPYYERFGFAPVPPGQIVLPGPADPARVLGLALQEGALARFSGLVRAA